MGRFHLVYYISMGTPSIEASLQMAETYLAHGVSALQFDLPSRNPYRETLFIRKRMAKAWESYGGYEPFLTALTEFRRKHPDFEMQMVSYEDVILTIGTVRYIEFCKQNNIKTCRISGDGVIELARMDMNAVGIDTLTFIDYNLPEKDVEFAVQTGRAVMLRNVRDGMEPRDGMISWDRRIRYLRKRGVNAPIYATAGITCGASLLEAKQAGASGAFVGSCLMNLWDDEPAMLALLADLEQAANS